MPPTYEVVGPRTVAGTAPGGLVDLDPELVNVPALQAAGHVRALPEGPVATDPGCAHPACVLDHPHAGPAELVRIKPRKEARR